MNMVGVCGYREHELKHRGAFVGAVRDFLCLTFLLLIGRSAIHVSRYFPVVLERCERCEDVR